MGLAASQARYLSLTARKTNVEYEGQQINQQRTQLANQSAGLFNQMLALEVPTPPVATDYQKSYYTFQDPATTDSIAIDYILPPYEEDGQTYYSVQATRKYSDSLVNYVSLSNVSVNPPSGDKGNYTISFGNGTPCTLSGPSTAKGLSNDEYFGKAYNDATGNTNSGSYKGDEKYFHFTYNNMVYYIPANKDETMEDFMKRMNGSEVDIMAFSVKGVTKSETTTYDKVILTQANDGTGRYETMTCYDKDGNPITFSLTLQTVQDDEAYEKAMQTYEAKKDIYDKTVADIDSKTAIIQQQDKTLELHLQQLDTEQQAIQTEMETIKKVIDKNIDETFKSFA